MRFLLFLLALVVVASVVFFYVVEGVWNGSNARRVAVINYSADRPVYHSAEVLNVTFFVHSSGSSENVSVRLRGLNGRLNEVRFFNLTDGVNVMWVAYKLPRCNVCGGIRAGVYNITYVVEDGKTSMNGSLVVDIRQ